MLRKYDVIVIGLGAMGSAACFHLAKRGLRVLGLEQFDIPNGNGSSSGFSRMVRMAYNEHPDYVPLLQAAFLLWQDLEAESGQKLFHLTGGLYMGPPEDKALQGALESARKYHLPYHYLDRSELDRRFPEFKVAENFTAMLETNAGLVIPELAIATHALRALLLGAELHGQEGVRSWRETEAGVEVVTAQGTYHAERVLFSGGAWTDKLVRDLGVPLIVTRQVLGWVWPKKTEPFELGRLPVWQIYRPDGSAHYGFPMMPDNPGFKLALHYPGQACDPNRVIRERLPGDEDSFREVLRTEIPAADGPLLSLRTCLYTNSPDKNFIIDWHPLHRRVLIACGFSGHGFKFAPVIGQTLADLLATGQSRHEIGFLGLDRFNC